MKTYTYATVPTIAQWKHDSSVAFAVRKDEPGLLRLDDLIVEFAKTPNDKDKRGPLLIDMFLTIEYWFRMREKTKNRVHEGRLPAMRGLFEVIVTLLGPYFRRQTDDLTRPAFASQVSEGIKQYIGLSMSEHGYAVDSDAGMGFAKFSEKQVWSYRLWFRNGLAYQAPWWAGCPGGRFQLAESKRGYIPMTRRDPNATVKPGEKDWSPFIMTLSRDIYMAKHDFKGRGHTNYFHSSYNDGQRVAMAGTIGIANGVIIGIRLDSGHYHPGQHNLSGFLWALRMYRVDLNKIKLLDFRGDQIGTGSAETFFHSGRSLALLRKGAVEETKKLRDNKDQRLERLRA